MAGPTSIYDTIPGTNAPKGSVSSTGFYFHYAGVYAANAAWYNGSYGNVIHFGTDTVSAPDAAALTPTEAYGVDNKIDDGIPGTGIIITYHNRTACNTGTATTGPTSTYLTTSSDVACHLIFKTGL